MTESVEPDMLPSVSVIVPTYRRPAQLRRCLEAIAAQAYPSHQLEVVVVDDGGGLDPRALDDLPPTLDVRIETQENQGPACARNRGVAAAAGEVVAFLDDDCIPAPHWLAELVAALVAEPAALAGGQVDNGLPDNIYAEASQNLVAYLYDYFPRGRALRPFLTSNNLACWREAFVAIGGFDVTFRYCAAEDRDLAERWQLGTGPLRYCARAVVAHHHQLSGYRFLRQHHFYGRGAVHLARRRRLRAQGPPLPEPTAFYTGMLHYPVRLHGGARGWKIAALIAIAQLAGITGMLVEAVGPSKLDAPANPLGQPLAHAGDGTHVEVC